MSLVATIPLPPDALSPNARVHWSARARATKNHRFAAFVSLAAAKREAKWRTMRPIVLDIEYRCHAKATGYKPKDATNALAALKAAIDGIVDAGIIGNDSARWLTLGKLDLRTRASDKKVRELGPGVTFTISEAE